MWQTKTQAGGEQEDTVKHLNHNSPTIHPSISKKCEQPGAKAKAKT